MSKKVPVSPTVKQQQTGVQKFDSEPKERDFTRLECDTPLDINQSIACRHLIDT
jgi:hypothetical protein